MLIRSSTRKRDRVPGHEVPHPNHDGQVGRDVYVYGDDDRVLLG